MNVFEAIILGLIQGLTEFLPVSSSGHLVLGQRLMDINTGSTTFEIMVHAATVLATITVFRKDILSLLKGGINSISQRKMNEQSSYILKIVVSMIPVLIVGLFLKSYVEALFTESVRFIGFMLLITALLLMVSYFLGKRASLRNKTHDVSWKDALIIGFAQACAVIPGISRSGSTISVGLSLGVSPDRMARFSFLMVLVPILGEAFLEILDGGLNAEVGFVPMLAGFVAAYLSGLFACGVMVRIVSKGKLYWFAIYCAMVGMAAIIFN